MVLNAGGINVETALLNWTTLTKAGVVRSRRLLSGHGVLLGAEVQAPVGPGQSLSLHRAGTGNFFQLNYFVLFTDSLCPPRLGQPRL